MTLLFEHPVLLLLPAALIAAALSYFLYRRDGKNKHFSPPLRMVLAVLRFLAFMFIAFFLLKPLLKTSERELEPPILLFAQDNSQSLVLNGDSSFYRNEWPAMMGSLAARMGEDYDVRGFSFGERLSERFDSIDFRDRATDLSEAINGLYNRYSNRNIGAVIIASDGIYNTGMNPLYSGRKLNAPVYTIALGDTTRRLDLRIAEVAANKLAYLGNRFPMEIVVEARKAAGQNTRVTVEHKGKTIYNEPLSITDDYLLETRKLLLDAKESGMQKYTITVEPIANEVTTRNNRREVYIEVLENRQKVLILGAAPHPDLAAIRKAIGSNLTYEVDVALANEFTGNVTDYSLVIFHRIPAITRAGQAVLNEVMAKGRPFLMVLGSGMDLGAFNNLKLGYLYSGYRESLTDIHGTYAKGFPHFNVDEESRRMFRDLPPLAVPFGDFQAAPGVVSLVNRRVGTIETEVPLISFNQVGATKLGIVGGEGLWRWRMVNYLRSGSHERFDRLVSGVVQYLASRDDRRRLKVSGPREVTESERIVFNAEVYNASYEPVNDPDVELVMRNADGELYIYGLGRTGTGYRLDLGSLPSGEYTWEATTAQGGQSFKESGAINITAIRLESANLEANHALLYRLAKENGGDMYFPNQLDALEQAIRTSRDVVTLSYERSKLADLINLRWLLFIVLALLSAEWLIRKWSGSY